MGNLLGTHSVFPPIILGVVCFAAFEWGLHMSVPWISISKDTTGKMHYGLEQWTRKEYFWGAMAAIGAIGVVFSWVWLVCKLSSRRNEVRRRGFPLD